MTITVNAAAIEEASRKLSNWGRWGKDDELGTLNLVTAAKRKQAAALVKDGVSVSLSADADTVQAVDNPTSSDSDDANRCMVEVALFFS